MSNEPVTLYANARAHIESKLTETERGILRSLFSYQWQQGYGYGKESQLAESSDELNAANETIGELRAEIERLTSTVTPPDDKPEIVVGSWWKAPANLAFTKVISIDPVVQTVVAFYKHEYNLENCITVSVKDFLDYFTPCDPPEWAPKDDE